jgi:hypothetical protein
MPNFNIRPEDKVRLRHMLDIPSLIIELKKLLD